MSWQKQKHFWAFYQKSFFFSKKWGLVKTVCVSTLATSTSRTVGAKAMSTTTFRLTTLKSDIEQNVVMLNVIMPSRESLLKEKDQYVWLPCTNGFRSAAFHNETIFFFSGGQRYRAFPFDKGSLCLVSLHRTWLCWMSWPQTMMGI